MNIIYGLSGEGYGHSSRALLIVPFLQKLGHRVKVLTDGKALEVLKDKFDVYPVQGMHFVFKNNRIKKRKTFWFNFRFLKNFINRRQLKKEIDYFNPDLFIVDFQPLIPLLAKIYRKPLISIDNNQAVSKFDYNVSPRHYFDFIIAKLINRMIIPYSDYFIITSFIQPDKKIKNTFIVPPLIREEVKKVKTSDKGPVVVYLNNADYVLDSLRQVDEKFIVYGFNINKKEGNLEFKTKESFLKDLARCKAVIGTAGFTLISEALYLKKPYLAIPQKGQFEQTFNAISVQKMGFGMYPVNFNKTDVIVFLRNLENYKKAIKKYNPNYDELFVVLNKILNLFKGKTHKK